MHVHILGICGTFMGGIAALARASGHRVTGSDQNVYPPMSDQLAALGIELIQGYDPQQLQLRPDVVVVGNVMSRGNALVEALLESGIPYTSGPEWLARHVLAGRWTLAVAGTHGKTTTSSLLAWLLEDAGLAPGFLIGGVPRNFGVSARLGGGKYFVVEADEYDTAFFDKRSKFVHYGPRTLILNNLEYDHADIFPDLASIERQFHHLVRTVPKSGRIVANGADEALARVLKLGCWSELEFFDKAGAWESKESSSSIPSPGDLPSVPSPRESGERVRVRGDAIEILRNGKPIALGETPLAGAHNRSNALAAIAAAAHVGVPVDRALQGLAKFQSVRRRMELVGEGGGVKVYDDFAHHPTAVEVTIAALRSQGDGRILAVLEPRSNTMRLGPHAGELAHSLRGADLTFVYARPDLRWDAARELASLGDRLKVSASHDNLLQFVVAAAHKGDRVLVMSNGDFGGIQARLVKSLTEKRESERAV
jgi:UDP-N-acetylmuramate: L-alanyl-gamma-D-glutamyl-meso-diaminopimelate ligase